MDIPLPLPLRGLIIGFTIAAAVGPISLLTMRRTLAHGPLVGLASGLGVATADGVYAGVAAFGLTAITSVLVSGRLVLGVVGGAVIILLGLRTMRREPAAIGRDARPPNLAAAFGSIFGLTMTNPMTIVSFAAVFAGIGLAAGATFGDALVLTLAVWAGSCLWWIALVALVSWFRGRISTSTVRLINRASGALLVVFGIVAIVVAFG